MSKSIFRVKKYRLKHVDRRNMFEGPINYSMDKKQEIDIFLTENR